jgi:hypothetical protein
MASLSRRELLTGLSPYWELSALLGRESTVRCGNRGALWRRSRYVPRALLAIGPLVVSLAAICCGLVPAPVTASMATPKSATTALSPACGHAQRAPVFLIGLSDQPLTTVQFASAEDGWVAGSRGILATSDGGRRWHLQYSGGAALQQVDFVGQADGWAMGQDQVLRTVDGGQRWPSRARRCGQLTSSAPRTASGWPGASTSASTAASPCPLAAAGWSPPSTGAGGGRRRAPLRPM